jgi:glycosyltransferase involved in cell wall biosynthesis
VAVRVLNGLGSMNPGGVETWLMHVLRNIDRERFHLDFCTFGDQPGLYAAEVEKLGSKVLRCPKGVNLWSFRHRFRRILREGRYDVVHSHVHLFSGALLRWAKAEGVPVRIAHSHNTRDGRPNTSVRHLYRKVMRSWINRYATHGLAASMPAARELFGEDWQSDSRFRVLYCGIDLKPFQLRVSREEIRTELGIPLEALVVGHVGRFDAQKNHRFILDIAGEILKRRAGTHFLLVGDGPLRYEVTMRARTMGFSDRMHFVGLRTDIPRLMLGAMDLFIFPSCYEGLGLVLLEAQAAGLHCFVSDGVPNEIAISTGSVDFLALSEGASYWASNVIQWLDEPRTCAASAIGLMSQSQFEISRSLAQLTSVYETREESVVPLFANRHA